MELMNIMAGPEHLITQKITISKVSPFDTEIEKPDSTKIEIKNILDEK